jgi:1-deoxy-D-xylulose-5-phosphate synthase
MAPKNKWELSNMVQFAVDFPLPIALRYPRGTAYDGLEEHQEPIVYGKSEIIYKEEDIAVVFVGHMAALAESVRQELKNIGYRCSLVNARFIKPLDTELFDQIAQEHDLIITIEENVLTGGYGQQVTDYVSRSKLPVHVHTIGIPDEYVEHGNVDVLRKEVGLDVNAIVKQILAEEIDE